MTSVEVVASEGAASGNLITGCPARFVFHLSRVLAGTACSFTIYDCWGQPITFFDSALHGPADDRDAAAGETYCCSVEELGLLPGRYRINAALYLDGQLQDHVEAACCFTVDQGAIRGRPLPHCSGYGAVIMAHRWQTP